MAGNEKTGIDTGIDTLIEEIEQLSDDLAHRVILYNDEFHFFDEVVLYVQIATGKSRKESYEITLEAHNKGMAVCYSGARDDCTKVVTILRKANLVVEME